MFGRVDSGHPLIIALILFTLEANTIQNCITNDSGTRQISNFIQRSNNSCGPWMNVFHSRPAVMRVCSTALALTHSHFSSQRLGFLPQMFQIRHCDCIPLYLRVPGQTTYFLTRKNILLFFILDIRRVNLQMISFRNRNRKELATCRK